LLDSLPSPESAPATAPPRSASAAFFQPRSRSRQRSNTNPISVPGPRQDLNDALVALGMKYRIYWECADILIELGGGSSGSASGAQMQRESTSAPAVSNACSSSSSSSNPRPKGRERAITLAGDESKPQPIAVAGLNGVSGSGTHNPAWRASTGRHDLNTRQLVLLKEMLGNPDSQVQEGPVTARSAPSPGLGSMYTGTAVNRQWKWGDVMSSTLTLPSEESTPTDVLSSDPAEAQQQKKRVSRVAAHMRDMLRLLKRKHDELPQVERHNQHQQIPQRHQPQQLHLQQFDTLPPRAQSAASASTESSFASHSHTYTRQIYAQPRAPSQSSTHRPRAKTSNGPESVSMRVRDERDRTAMAMGSLTHAQFSTTSFTHKSSPRRPSLSSIFRFSQKGKTITSLGVDVLDHVSASRSQLNLSAKGHNKGSTTEEEDYEEEEDWDHLDSASDMEHMGQRVGADGASTLKGSKKGTSPYLQDPRQQRRGGSRPVTPNQSQNPSQSSLFADTSLPSSSPHSHHLGSLGPRTTRLSNVEEIEDEDQRTSRSRKVQSFFGSSRTPASPGRLKARRSLGKSDSIRSVPVQPTIFVDPGKLAMTPENIKPLLQNAKEVYARLQDCVEETKALLANVSTSVPSPSPASAPVQ
jgi:serine/arginine repetitive matrix protein 2